MFLKSLNYSSLIPGIIIFLVQIYTGVLKELNKEDIYSIFMFCIVVADNQAKRSISLS